MGYNDKLKEFMMCVGFSGAFYMALFLAILMGNIQMGITAFIFATIYTYASANIFYGRLKEY